MPQICLFIVQWCHFYKLFSRSEWHRLRLSIRNMPFHVETAVKLQGANADITERSAFFEIAFYTKISRIYPILYALHRTDHDFNLSSFCPVDADKIGAVKSASHVINIISRSDRMYHNTYFLYPLEIYIQNIRQMFAQHVNWWSFYHRCAMVIFLF